MGKNNKSEWRPYAANAINKVLEDNPDVKDVKEITRLIRDAYPFGERKYHPYKIWCDEVQKTLIRKGFVSYKNSKKKLSNKGNWEQIDPNQTALF